MKMELYTKRQRCRLRRCSVMGALAGIAAGIILYLVLTGLHCAEISFSKTVFLTGGYAFFLGLFGGFVYTNNHPEERKGLFRKRDRNGRALSER